MLGHQQDVLVVGQADELAADQWSGREIEWRTGFGCTQLGQRLLTLGRLEHAQVVFGKRKAAVGRGDDLDRAVGAAGEGGAQAFVAGHDTVQGGAQGVAVERPLQAQRGWQVVGGAGGMVELVEEPQPLLGPG
jgi:hypothetical protein